MNPSQVGVAIVEEDVVAERLAPQLQGVGAVRRRTPAPSSTAAALFRMVGVHEIVVGRELLVRLRVRRAVRVGAAALIEIIHISNFTTGT